MNMKKRMNKMSGLQQSIVETQQQKNHIQDKTTHKKTKDKNKTQEPIKKTITPSPEKVLKEEEVFTFDGKEMYSYHPKVHEVFQMTDTNEETIAGL